MNSSLKFLMPVIFIVLSISCTTNKSDDKSSKQEIPGLLDEFKIFAYCGPPLSEVNEQRYREIADAGIDMLAPANGTFTAEQHFKALDLAQKVGIKIIPIDLRLNPFVLKSDIPVDTAAIKEIVSDYKDHPALAAYLIKDEPNAELYPTLRDFCEVFRSEDPKHEPLINIFPSFANNEQLGVDGFRKYVQAYINIVKPTFLSYDYYPFKEELTRKDGWFNDLEIVREESKNANIPFMLFIQSEGIKNYLRVPNRAEILWQVNTALAYGARGFGWFSYWTPTPDQGLPQEEGAEAKLVEQHYNAMIDKDGNRTDVYDYVREANLYLRKAGRGFDGWENAFVAGYENGKLIDGGNSPVITPVGENANLVVGTFIKDNCHRIVISNRSWEEKTEFKINLPTGTKIKNVFTSIDATSMDGETHEEWILNPGGSIVLDI
jgi:hypothetical protein